MIWTVSTRVLDRFQSLLDAFNADAVVRDLSLVGGAAASASNVSGW